ncbi:hypothetical protein XH80_09450 [Bradyrhizobium sp. CCBAU 45384]|nr:hypothetical protein [Bradyrhizobium sp. CCBAU 45384]
MRELRQISDAGSQRSDRCYEPGVAVRREARRLAIAPAVGLVLLWFEESLNCPADFIDHEMQL